MFDTAYTAELITIITFIVTIIAFLFNKRREIILYLKSNRKRKRILKTKEIVVAITHYPPLALISNNPIDEKYSASGIFVDLIKLFAQKHNLSIEFVPARWDRLKEHIQQDGCDIILPVFSSKEREKYGAVIGNCYAISLGAVSKKTNQNINSLNDLLKSNLKIAVTEGEVGWEYIKEFHSSKLNASNIIINKSHDITNSMCALLNDQVELVLADSLSCDRFIKENDTSESLFHNPFVGQAMPMFECGIMTDRKETKFMKWIQEEIIALRNQESFVDIESAKLKIFEKLITRRNIMS